MRLLALLLVLLAPSAVADDWGAPTAEYSARLTFVDGRGEKLEHRVYVTAERQRLDYKTGEREEIVIVDRAAAAVYVLYPGLKKYRRSAFVDPELDFGIGRAGTRRERLGEEAVAGTGAVKYRVEAKTLQGQEFKGLAWITAQRILVKLDGEIRQGPRVRRLTMTASELKVGPVDAAMFRIPADYARLEDKAR